MRAHVTGAGTLTSCRWSLPSQTVCDLSTRSPLSPSAGHRAVVRVHKEVLLLQAELWGLLAKSSVKVREVDKAFDELEAGTQRAHQVYKR